MIDTVLFEHARTLQRSAGAMARGAVRTAEHKRAAALYRAAAGLYGDAGAAGHAAHARNRARECDRDAEEQDAADRYEAMHAERLETP